ncbi:O-antigen ligase family protein [Coxiella endosymbiont of Amblyomma nuttalli]|uniref:O-antigen ligase family protein n=1 Tax=Coxiella endosymbiont of Amblyomma nuttalli TaxID=2749996 RepID=UPI001FD4B355|nr:O-antigen ligase family protein [Coxiella endosymbiont of Amblyomma nuttalli]
MFISLLIAIILSELAFHFSNEFKLRIVQIVSNTKYYYQQGQVNTSLGIRIQSIKNAYFLFKETPWFGHGTGSFRTVYATLPQDQIKATGIIPLSYNSYLNIGVELGILGIALLLLNFILQWQHSFLLPEENCYLMQVLLISMIIGCVANPWLSDTTELHLYALSLVINFSRKD